MTRLKSIVYICSIYTHIYFMSREPWNKIERTRLVFIEPKKENASHGR